MAELRRLYFDIETSPCLGWFWRPGYKINLNYGNIIEQAKIICICYKWSTSKKIHHLTWDNKQCDKKMLKKFIRILNQADIIVGHNSDKFDVKWIRTRCLYHNIEMMPDYKSLDTLKQSRGGFNFPSNRLDAIGRYLGAGKKIKTTEELWLEAWRNNSKSALNEMVRYCKQDVILLEDVFNKLHPYTKHKHTTTREYLCDCPSCGSSRTTIRGYIYTAAGVKQIKVQCQDCRKWNYSNFNKFYKERARQQNDIQRAKNKRP